MVHELKSVRILHSLEHGEVHNLVTEWERQVIWAKSMYELGHYDIIFGAKKNFVLF